MICKGCGFPFPPHELRGEECFECVWKRLERVEKERDELRQVAEIANRVRGNAMADLERVQQQADEATTAIFELCSYYPDWLADAGERPIDKVRAVNDQMIEVRKQAAAMKEALQSLVAFSSCVAEVNCPKCRALDVLHESDAGANYISKESVKPLVEALKFCSDVGVSGNFDCVGSALAHARTLGL